MRTTYSRHTAPALSRASDIWPHFLHKGDFHPLLKLQGLFDQILHKVSPPDPKMSKKRAGSPLPQAPGRKKQKNVESLISDSKEQVLDFKLSLHLDAAMKLPTWRHTFALRYTLSINETSSVTSLTEILGVLRTLCGSLAEPTTIDIGQCQILNLEGKLVSFWAKGRPDFYNEWLLLPLSAHEKDYSIVLRSCYELQQIHKVKIEAHMKIIIFPEGSHNSNNSELPFEIQLQIAVSMDHPSSFNFLDRRMPKKRADIVREHQRKLCYFLYGRTSDSENIPHNIDIPFFYSILTSAPQALSQLADAAMQPDALLPTLLPYQRRSVAWLLSREGKEVSSEGFIVPRRDEADYSFWESIQEENNTFAYNRLARMISDEKDTVERSFGGILAEEPGLGKTLEIVALILLNPAPENRTPRMIRWDPLAGLNVKAVKTSLIVTPSSLAGQWVDEINTHAPSLKVLVYEGWSKVAVPILNSPEEIERTRKLLKKSGNLGSMIEEKRTVTTNVRSKKGKGKVRHNDGRDVTEESNEIKTINVVKEGGFLSWCDYVQGFDIVVTTYATLRSDFNVARAATERPRREEVSYANVERPRSPLVMVEWMRVVMDEVQMVGGGKTEEMVSLIPRLASFAVSGTPARSHVSDLKHVLKFLRVDNVVGGPQMWKELLQPYNATDFGAFFQKYSIRTVKADVKDELTIPQQTRYVVGVELGPVEREVYNQMLQKILNELGLDAHGIAASIGWQVDASYLRNSLRKLRALCTHPQVGQLQWQGDKPMKTLKSMQDVLEDLKDKNWRSIIDDSKAKIQGLCDLAQYQQQTQDPNRHHTALQTLRNAEGDISQLIEELENANRWYSGKRKASKTPVDSEALNNGATSDNKDNGHETSPHEEETTIPEEEQAVRRRTLNQRLRETKLVLHRIKFLQGDVYHVLDNQHSSEESYGVANEIRRELLKGPEEETLRLIMSLNVTRTRREQESITEDDLFIKVPYLPKGCKSRDTVDLRNEADAIINNILNKQSALLWEWRTHIIQLLSQEMNGNEREPDGQEYQRTLESQGEAEVYLQLYAALLADRREALLHERTLLALHDVREKKLRQTAAAMKAATMLEELTSSKNHGPEISNVTLQPEDEITHTELSARRKVILQELGDKALRTTANSLHGVATSLRKDPEMIWAKNAANQLRRLITEQELLNGKLDADLMFMRKVFNYRIVYFRQLQEISDSVIPAKWEGSIDDVIRDEADRQEALDAKIRAGRSKQKYLSDLVQGEDDDNEETCILCKCEFVRGFVTSCAHIFCQNCMQAWMAERDGKTCPICRSRINNNTLQKFTVKSKPVAEAKSRIHSKLNEPNPQSHRVIIYNTLCPEVLEAIQQVQILGDFGSKIQTLVQHLLYLQVNDPGSKSIVFSAWADSLHIVHVALSLNGIRSLRIDQISKGDNAAKIFRKDPGISVLLLHGERENAGLNLTCASRVFLLESVVHHGFELQAIARIDRLGQSRPTEVYCYYAENTVERNILDLATRQGTSLYTKESAVGTLDVSRFELDDSQKVIDSPATKKKGDFIFQVDDMLAILFPHMYEDIGYLVSDEATANDSIDTHTGSGIEAQMSGSRVRHVNAVAGPSCM